MEIIWSATTRLLHWGIAGAITLAYFVDGGDSLHNYAGYVALVLTMGRLIWGFIASDMANFRQFPLSIRSLRAHARAMINNERPLYRGHNPFASWTYILMWVLVAGLGVTGYLLGTDRFWGSESMEEMHELMANTLLFLIVLHFLGLFIDSIKYRRKTWWGMIDGKRQ